MKINENKRFQWIFNGFSVDVPLFLLALRRCSSQPGAPDAAGALCARGAWRGGPAAGRHVGRSAGAAAAAGLRAGRGGAAGGRPGAEAGAEAFKLKDLREGL